MSIQPALTKNHEGYRSKVYLDTKGKKTIGWGFNLADGGARAICAHFGLNYDGLCSGSSVLNRAHADAVFSFQYGKVLTEAHSLFPNFDAMPEKAQAVIADLLFNMGYTTFSGFDETIPALREGRYSDAAALLQKTLWFKQVGNRAKEDIALLRSIT